MADVHVIDELRSYLIAQGVCVAQTAKDAPATLLPTIWLNPRPGAPHPRQKTDGTWQEDATITLVDMLLGPPIGELDAYLEEAFIKVVVSARQLPLAKMIHRQIRGLIHPVGATHGRQLWTMNTLLVEYSTIWRGEQPVTETDSAWSRDCGYRFGCRRKALAGLPYAP